MSKDEELKVPLASVLTQPDQKGVNKAYVEIINSEEIPVLCINQNTKKTRLMPFKVLFDNNANFWQQSGNWEYYLTEEGFNKLKEKAIVKHGSWLFERPKAEKKAVETAGGQEEVLEELEAESGFGSDYNTFVKMSTEQKLDFLVQNKKRLNDLTSQKVKDQKIITEALVDSTKAAALINHAALVEAINLADDEAKKFTQEFVEATHEMVKSSAQLFFEDVFSDNLMNTLVEKSNGTIVQHMTRVYLNGIAFLSFYNNLVSTTSTIQKLRISFASKYREFYHVLLPHMNIDFIDLERVFYGGMRAVPPDLFYKWAVGFLIHDIGKASSIEYHEGEAAYDRDKVIEHVKMGYKSIMSKTNYPMEASLITGYHHEYYGDADGYGYFRAYLKQYKKNNPNAKQNYCISFELEPILDYQALAYFPAKVLEIVDVFDSVTDPNRIYRKAMTHEEALTMMREQFIEKHPKIDPILFDIFDLFIREKDKKNAASS